MTSAESRAIWSWVSVTDAPWSTSTTMCLDWGRTAATYTGLQGHEQRVRSDESPFETAKSDLSSFKLAKLLKHDQQMNNHNKKSLSGCRRCNKYKRGRRE